MASVSLPPIHKRSGNFGVSEYESEILDLNGQLLVLTFERVQQTDAFGAYIKVRDFHTGEILARNSWLGGLGCAIVIAGEIHVFGASDWSGVGNSVLHSVLDSSFAPSAPNAVLTIPGVKIYNTDIDFDGTRYVMAVETAVAVGSGVTFYQSTDLAVWAQVGTALMPGVYCACPSISFVNGKFFITALAKDGTGNYVTCPYLTADFVTFRSFTGNTEYPGYICFLAPDSGAGEGTNTSDVSLCESNGMVYGVYLVGDQMTWMNLRTFVYLQPLTDLIGEFWMS